MVRVQVPLAQRGDVGKVPASLPEAIPQQVCRIAPNKNSSRCASMSCSPDECTVPEIGIRVARALPSVGFHKALLAELSLCQRRPSGRGRPRLILRPEP